MADENVTASENTTETNEQAATPATQASKPAVPSPAAMKPHAPSPAAFAKKAPQRPATSTGFSEADIKATEAFGRVADDGTARNDDRREDAHRRNGTASRGRDEHARAGGFQEGQLNRIGHRGQ